MQELSDSMEAWKDLVFGNAANRVVEQMSLYDFLHRLNNELSKKP